MATDVISNDLPLALPAAVPPPVDPLEVVPPAVDHLLTEDDTPVDSFFAEKQQRLLTEPLHSSWAAGHPGHPLVGPGHGSRSFVAAANVGLFFVARNPALVPDMLLCMDVALPPDVHPKPYRSYFIWEYGKPPDVVIEVVSNREGGEDSLKLAAYARGRVPYYVIYDPDRLLGDETLRGYRLDATEYRKIDGPIDFPGIGLGVRIWHGRYEDLDNTWLRWVDAGGVPVPTGQERADAEQQRADAEQQRADRLAEQLRQHGVQPAE